MQLLSLFPVYPGLLLEGLILIHVIISLFQLIRLCVSCAQRVTRAVWNSSFRSLAAPERISLKVPSP